MDNRTFVGSVVEWLKRRAYDQYGPGSKLTPAILLCPWEKHFMAFPLIDGLDNSSKLQSYLY